MSKAFIVGPVIPAKHLPSTFEVEIRVMHGDADAYDTFVVRPFHRGKDEEAMISLLETLERMQAKYPNGRGGSWPDFGFQNIEGFYSWFGTDWARTEEEYKTNYPYTTEVPYEVFLKHRALADGRSIPDWPWDVTGAEVEADFEKYTVYYYDEDGIQHTVSVVPSV